MLHQQIDINHNNHIIQLKHKMLNHIWQMNSNYEQTQLRQFHCLKSYSLDDIIYHCVSLQIKSSGNLRHLFLYLWEGICSERNRLKIQRVWQRERAGTTFISCPGISLSHIQTHNHIAAHKRTLNLFSVGHLAGTNITTTGHSVLHWQRETHLMSSLQTHWWMTI